MGKLNAIILCGLAVAFTATACQAGAPASAPAGVGSTANCIWTQNGEPGNFTPAQQLAVDKVAATIRAGLTEKELGYVYGIRYSEIPAGDLEKDAILAKVLTLARSSAPQCYNGALSLPPGSYGQRSGAISQETCDNSIGANIARCYRALPNTDGNTFACIAWGAAIWVGWCKADEPTPTPGYHADADAWVQSPQNMQCEPACTANETCDALNQKCDCNPNRKVCGNTCVNTASDSANCGGCGALHECDAGQGCKDSQCVSYTTCGNGKCEAGEATSCPKDCSKCADGATECVLSGTSVNKCVSGQWKTSSCPASEQCKCTGSTCGCATGLAACTGPCDSTCTCPDSKFCDVDYHKCVPACAAMDEVYMSAGGGALCKCQPPLVPFENPDGDWFCVPVGCKSKSCGAPNCPACAGTNKCTCADGSACGADGLCHGTSPPGNAGCVASPTKTPGCGGCMCEACLCSGAAPDPFCCTDAWDAQCASECKACAGSGCP